MNNEQHTLSFNRMIAQLRRMTEALDNNHSVISENQMPMQTAQQFNELIDEFTEIAYIAKEAVNELEAQRKVFAPQFRVIEGGAGRERRKNDQQPEHAPDTAGLTVLKDVPDTKLPFYVMKRAGG